MALTFDDGPDPRFTPRLLATLDARRVHVTFFLLGPMVQAAPGLAAHRLGLRPILWSSWGREWVRGATPGSVQATLASTLDGGATVLLHDSEAAAPAGTAAAALGRAALAAGRVRPPRAAGRPARRASGGRSPARMTTPCLRDDHRAHKMTTASGVHHGGSGEVKAVLCGK